MLEAPNPPTIIRAWFNRTLVQAAQWIQMMHPPATGPAVPAV